MITAGHPWNKKDISSSSTGGDRDNKLPSPHSKYIHLHMKIALALLVCFCAVLLCPVVEISSQTIPKTSPRG